MNLTKIATIAIITISATLLTGCEDGLQKELTDCQLTNTKLQSDIEAKQMVIAKRDTSVKKSVDMISEIVMENEKLKREITALKKTLMSMSTPMPKTQTKKPKQTPEERARIQKGLQELFKLQKESAEKMRLEKLKKEGKQ
jgi:hypothetical protein